jgi:ubiquinone/menaquinone biosynthesis C-methylase UbiE
MTTPAGPGPRQVGFSWALKHWFDLRIGALFSDTKPGSTVVLLGSGTPAEKRHLQALGFRVVSLDINPTYAGVDVIGDAHALPFREASIDCIATFQVLEHLKLPWVAITEVARVLKPDGQLIGSVAFLKEFHGSYFHMTHWGVIALLEHGGLWCEQVYGGQNIFGRLIGSLFKFRSGKVTETVLNGVGGALFQCRNVLWSVLNRTSYNRPLSRFDDRRMSFKDYQTLKYAPTVVFKARKTVSQRTR